MAMAETYRDKIEELSNQDFAKLLLGRAACPFNISDLIPSLRNKIDFPEALCRNSHPFPNTIDGVIKSEERCEKCIALWLSKEI